MIHRCVTHDCGLALDALRGLVCPQCDAVLHRELAAAWSRRWRWVLLVYLAGVTTWLLLGRMG